MEGLLLLMLLLMLMLLLLLVPLLVLLGLVLVVLLLTLLLEGRMRKWETRKIWDFCCPWRRALGPPKCIYALFHTTFIKIETSDAGWSTSTPHVAIWGSTPVMSVHAQPMQLSDSMCMHYSHLAHTEIRKSWMVAHILESNIGLYCRLQLGKEERECVCRSYTKAWHMPIPTRCMRYCNPTLSQQIYVVMLDTAR